MDNRIFLSPPHMSGKEQEYIAQAFESNYIAPLGPFVNRFEEIVQNYTSSPYALATINATSAIHLALRVLGISRGDYVLASSFTFIGSISAVLYQNASPIFIDSDEKSWNLDPLILEEAIKKAPKKPKALILTHLYGQCADIEAITLTCKAHGIYLIEDAAESMGATCKNQQSGTFGDFGVYSFNGNKILSTSGGGILVSHNKEWIRKASFYATQAKDDMPYYEHTEYGYNYRMSNILAAIGVAQMEVLDERVMQCRQIFSWYKQELFDVKEITFMPELPNTKGNRWLTTLTLSKTDPLHVIQELQKHNIEARLLWKPMHLQPLFKDSLHVSTGVSENLFKQGLCLPSGTQMSHDDVLHICSLIKKALQ
ncbi:MAG: DegT/DnrJ/EryC1/StrS family aminotransferase [Campylobacterota bacterium]|nr:DegT/DnrJ/EryC1/StrS family aminotransferase [Campylobacterota bacterium]